jgi:ribosomal protein L11 methyltransferase
MTEQLNYTEVRLDLSPVDPGRDVLTAELAELGFDSFQHTENGLLAWCATDKFHLKVVKDLIDQYQKQWKITFYHEMVKPVNWNEEWEKNYAPVVVANRCSIRAPFHEPRPDLEYDIVIEPKMSFGTAHHDTTALMIQWLLETDVQSLEVLDMGCGTGVLGVLAALKEAHHVTAVDNYIWACENTEENSLRNGTENSLSVLHGDAAILSESDKKYHLIIANINRNVILEDLNSYLRQLLPGGKILLSGFLEEDAHLIHERGIAAGLTPDGEKKQNQWISLRFIK